MVKKQFLKENKKKSKHAPQVPSTADEYLAAGVDFEEAGEKWRAGDAAKSTRFFVRAIDTYDEALRRFPDSFDLAYNKARVQYELTQYPKLMAQLPGSLVELLGTALESSRRALGLKGDNADVLFSNTAQVLTSLVEAISESRGSSSEDSLTLLEEAIELFQRCLALQEYQYTESQTQAQATFDPQGSSDDGQDTEEGGAPISEGGSQAVEDDRWATIVEPVTLDSLLDTLLAQLQTLTTLCGLMNADAGRGLAWVEEYSTPLIEEKLQKYLQGNPDREQEAGITRANFIAALADANFRVQRIDIGTYERALNDAYASVNVDDYPEGLCNKAEAFISYNSSLRMNFEAAQAREVSISRWKVLTAALDSLTKASKLPTADNLPKIHLLRGDAELLRLQLGQPPSNYDIATKNGAVLAKNAEKFYRGAGTLAKNEGAKKEAEEAAVKEALAVGLSGETGKLLELVKMQPELVRGVLEDAVDDGLVSYEAFFNQQDQYKASSTEQYTATTGATSATSGAGAASGDLSKDEVGWYFVEQYYTTLSKSPEKLHLFYGKRSQFVSGLEGASAPVSVGRSVIQERIRDLDFQDCKVRVTNVDSQASFENIVIQVIGETSNKSAEPKKFVQTFVLAQQPTGYFVLNDIFRYINEEVEEEQGEASADAKEESAPAALVEDVEMPAAPAAAEEPAAAPLDPEVVDKKLEETIKAEETEAEPATNGTPAEPAAEPEEKPEEPKVEDSPPTPEEAEKEVEKEIQEPEKPKDPLPTPDLSRQPSTTAPAAKPAPVQPATPAKPLSWASRAAAAVGSGPKPAVPVVQPKTTATPPAQSRPAPAQAAAAPAPAAQPAKPTTPAPTPATPATDKKENTSPGAGWQTAGGDHIKRQNRPQSISAPPEKEGTMGYVRNVTANVKDEDLRSTLGSFGELIYFDINRGKNCAFVEYANAAGYQAASAANPHKVGDETIYVEPRRPKANAYGGNGYSGGRGGMNQRGRGGFEQGRSGSQSGRGNFGPGRGRGGAGGASRGARSGTAQAS
ncbi:hypothetical protein CJF30_00009319 [Rutstroemia sp. NJR-2017a BBW]|nr:hypothetical protein CJF30_00009319 [Rutstroemia sp. NJR-2017a BBW]